MKKFLCIMFCLFICIGVIACAEYDESIDISGTENLLDTKAESSKEIGTSDTKATSDTKRPQNTESNAPEEPPEEYTDGLDFISNGDNTYSVSGYIGNSTEVIIPSKYKGLPVTQIKAISFYMNDRIKKVTIGSNVEIIGTEAFAQCANLSTVIFSDSLKQIDDGAFSLCEKLYNISLPDSVVYFGDGVFDYTGYYNTASNWDQSRVLYIGSHLIKATTDISGRYTVKSGTVTIARNAFYDCSGLTGVIIPNSVEVIGNCAFYYSGLTTIEIGLGLREIHESAFLGCKFESIMLPDTLVRIEKNAFLGCDSLKNIYFMGPIGWKRYSTYFPNGTDISFTQSGLAAEYLTNDYYTSYFLRG